MIFIGLCIYAFVEGITVVTVEHPLVVEKNNSDIEELLTKAGDKKATATCDEEGFWAKYNVWGDIDAVYTPLYSDKIDISTSCDELLDDGISQ